MNENVQDIYPLSATQKGLLFHSLQQEGSGVYIVQVSFSLQGELNHQATKHAWQTLLMRHDVLRTAFVWENQAQPLQVVGKQASLPFTLSNWQHLSEQAQQQGVSDYLKADRLKGFPLNKAPLIRVQGFQLRADLHRFVLSFHHIILDGWSMPQLLQEWMAIYMANMDGLAMPLGPTRPFRDYIAWLHRHTPQGLATDKQAVTATAHPSLDFWQTQLAGINAPTPLGLATRKNTSDKPPMSEAGSQTITLSPETTQALQALAKQHRLTVNILVQGAWALLLHRLSGENTVLYGTTRSGRPAALQDAEKCIGLFINTVPMPVSIQNHNTVLSLLTQLQQQQLDQQAHELTPLSHIHQLSEIPQNTALFQSIVVFENYPMENAFAPYAHRLSMRDIAITEQTNYPLSWYIVVKEGLEIKALFDTVLYDSNSIAPLLQAMKTLLEGFIANIEQNINELRLFDQRTQQQLCEQWNPEPVDFPKSCVSQQVTDTAAKHSEKIAVRFDQHALTYQALEDQSNQLAHVIQQHIDTDTPKAIGLCMHRSTDMVVAMLAILKTGCHYVPMDPSYPTSRLAYFLEQSAMPLIISHRATTTLCNNLLSKQEQNTTTQLDIDEQATTIITASTSPLAQKITRETLSYIIYTSGSTGQPKGVAIEPQNLSNLLNAFRKKLNVTHNDHLLSVTTLSFDIAALEIFLPLISGATLVIASEDDCKDSQRLNQLLEQQHISIMQATPATWRLLVQGGWTGRPQLTALCGGEALDLALAEHLLTRCQALWNVYGPTETTIWSSALKLQSQHLSTGQVPIGQPIDNTRFYVMDDQQRLSLPGCEGELVIAGSGVGRGYHQRPDLTQERFLPDLFLKADSPLPKRMYRTGDRVRYRDDGNLDYLGRIDNQAKLRGYRLELGEIEAVLAKHPSVEQVVVVIRGANSDNAQLVAFVISHNGAMDTEALQQLAKQYLPHYMVPTLFQTIERFPLTLNGKIDRLTLSQQALRENNTRVHTPSNPIETELVVIWKRLLQREQVGTRDNFFELGGHSLLVMTMKDAIKQQLNISLDIVEIFRYPTINSLAMAIKQQQNNDTVVSTDANPPQQNRRSRGAQRLKKRQRKPQPEVQTTPHTPSQENHA